MSSSPLKRVHKFYRSNFLASSRTFFNLLNLNTGTARREQQDQQFLLKNHKRFQERLCMHACSPNSVIHFALLYKRFRAQISSE